MGGVNASGTVGRGGISKAIAACLPFSDDVLAVRYRTILENARDGLVLADANRFIIEVNPAFLEMFGLREPAAAARADDLLRDYAFKNPRGAPLSFDMLPLSLALRGTVVNNCEIEAVRRTDRKTIVGEYTAVPVRGESGAVEGAVVSVRDITGRKMAERDLVDSKKIAERRTAELVIANRELEMFVFLVAHTLKEPLRAIGGFSRLLLDAYFDSLDRKGKDYIKRIRAGAARMDQLIDDMEFLSKVTRREINCQKIDISALARSALDELKTRDGGRRVETAVQNDLYVNADRRLLLVALQNLIGNAWKFTSKTENAKIEFGAVAAGRRVFYIRDNGAGFEMKHAGRMFIPFQRFHSHEEFPGSGIGLAIVERVIRRHGGKVWAEAKPGKGAVFYFTL